MLEKIALLKAFYSTPWCIDHRGVIYEYEWLQEYSKNSKSILEMPIGTRRSCLTKKTGDEKSRDTNPSTAGN